MGGEDNFSLENFGVGDLTVVIGEEEKRLEVNRLYLMQASPLLSSLIQSFHAGLPNELLFPDETPEHFHFFIQFCYTGTFSCDSAETLSLLISLAYKIQAQGFFEKCAERFPQLLTVENVLGIFASAKQNLHGGKFICNICLQFICTHAKEILKLEQFNNLPEECVEAIISQDELMIERELDLYQALYNWGLAQDKRFVGGCTEAEEEGNSIRRRLKRLLKHVRWMFMSPDQFSLHVLPRNLLSTDEILSIFIYYTTYSPPGRNELLDALKRPRSGYKDVKAGNPTPFRKLQDMLDYKRSRSVSSQQTQTFEICSKTQRDEIGAKIQTKRLGGKTITYEIGANNVQTDRKHASKLQEERVDEENQRESIDAKFKMHEIRAKTQTERIIGSKPQAAAIHLALDIHPNNGTSTLSESFCNSLPIGNSIIQSNQLFVDNPSHGYQVHSLS